LSVAAVFSAVVGVESSAGLELFDHVPLS